MHNTLPQIPTARNLAVLLSVFTILFSSLLLTGCIKNQPGDTDIKAMATERFEQDFSGLFVVSNIVKDNGYKQNDYQYVAELTITATAQQSLEEYAQSLMQDSSLSGMEKMAQSMTIGLLKLTMPKFAAGDQLEFKRNYLFIDTDKGWMLKKELNPETDNPLER